MLIRVLIAVAAVAVGWVALGRHLALLVDRVFTVRVATLPANQVTFEVGAFEIGGQPLLTTKPDNQPLELVVGSDASKHVVLRLQGKTLALGSPAPDSTGTSVHAVVPESGDVVTFTLDRSSLSWPTPLDFNFMTGHSPSWKRNLYYRFVWTKPSGGKLEAVWRYQQWFYPGLGWSGEGGMTKEGETGLIRLDLVPDR